MMAAKLLLVEDDPALSELLEYRFQNEGYNVRCTKDGDDALILAREEVPDLVILDWMIEGTSGIEVCRQLRRDKETAHVPIIMLTARVEETDRLIGLELGADDYITKPFHLSELNARIKAIYRRKNFNNKKTRSCWHWKPNPADSVKMYAIKFGACSFAAVQFWCLKHGSVKSKPIRINSTPPSLTICRICSLLKHHRKSWRIA
mgnify:CR=1 FL=1